MHCTAFTAVIDMLCKAFHSDQGSWILLMHYTSSRSKGFEAMVFKTGKSRQRALKLYHFIHETCMVQKKNK